jgi:hypothetical protein
LVDPGGAKARYICWAATGGIPFHYARLFPDEITLIHADPELALLPARPEPEES